MKNLLLLGAFALSINAFGQVPNYVPTNGLVGWWGFNGNANDESGNGNNGTVNGNATLSIGYDGSNNSAYLWPNTNSSQNYINLGNLSQYLPNAISIAQWIFFDGATSNSRVLSTGEQGIIVHSDVGGVITLKCSYDVSGAQIWPSSFQIAKNAWHHIIFTSEGGTAKLYVNNVLTDVSTNPIAPSISNFNWNIGRKSIPSYDGFGGIIDDMGIWNRALTQCEISALYNSVPLVGIDTQSACDSYTWVDGNTYTTSNNSATYTTSNAAGCDSTVTLDLTITNSTSSTDTQSACDSYTWVDGNTYTTSNNSATYTTNNAAGCDSTVTLDLTINPTPDNSITQNGGSLTATQTGATYQWIDCDNFFVPVIGEVNQTFFPSLSGYYAVEVTIGDCSSTSECRLVDFTGIDEIESLISVHPNPTKDEVTLSIGTELLGTGFVVTDNAGRIILTDTFKSTKQTVNLSGFDNGVYFIRTDKDSPVKIIKQ